MNKAYSYIRFSDPKQAAGDSYRRQLEDTLTYCKDNNLTLVSESDYMFFDEGISAYSGKLRNDETELSRFYKLVQSGAIPSGSTLIIESLDRLSREHVREALPRFWALLKAGINIHTLHSNKTYTHDVANDIDLIHSILEMSRSHNESLWKAKRISARWKEKQENADSVKLGKTAPAWLEPVYHERDKENKKKKPTHFIENDERVAVIRKIFQYTLDGYGRNVVARMLNEEGIPAFRTTAGWGASSIHKVLTSISVLGHYQPTTTENGKRVPRGEPIKDYYPTIIDSDLFEKARIAVATRSSTKARKQTAEFQVWQGLAICALCGSPLHSYSNGRKPAEGQKAIRWMRCYAAKKAKCGAGSIQVNKLEPVFKEILAKLNILALVQSSASEINAKLEVVSGKLVAERAKLADFRNAYATRRSETVLSLIYETEEAVEALEVQEKDYMSDLAADKIVDKEDFFARLDLHSFPGRSRANSILKRLKVKIGINTTQQRFHVIKDGKPAFDLVLVKEDSTIAYPADREHSAIIQTQDGTFTPFTGTNNDDDLGNEEYESEGQDARDGY
jgi:DNA invertase Pin-like site-specific DNA recombinase